MKKFLSVLLAFAMTQTILSSPWLMAYDKGMTSAAAENLSSFEDRNGTMPDNLIPKDKESSARYFVNQGRNSGSVDSGYSSDWSSESNTRSYAVITANEDISERIWSAFCGKTVPIQQPLTGKSYVIKMNVKKTTDVGAKVAVSLNNDTATSVSVSDRYAKNGMELTDAYQQFTDTITPVDGYSSTSEKQYLTVGLPAGVQQGAGIAIDTSTPDAVYLAEEVPYEITLTAEKDILQQGESCNITASVLNQIGIKGNVSQEIRYSVMNEDRTETDDNLSVENGKIIAKPDATSGTYTVVAMTADGSVVKGVSVSVIGRERVSDCTMTQSGNDVIANASVSDTTAEKVIWLLGEYSGKLLKQITCTTAVPTNGKASAALTLHNTEAGDTVKLFVWEYPSLRPISDTDGIERSMTVQSLESLYGDTIPDSSLETAQPTKFYKNKAAAVSVTFDDSIYSAACYYNSLFESYNMRGTAMLVADWVKETEKDGWQQLFDGGHMDMGNHSLAHAIKYTDASTTSEMIEQDITGGYQKLSELFPTEKILTFASPWTQRNDLVDSEVAKHHFANRNGGRGFVSAYPDQQTLFNLPAYVVMHTDTAAELNAKIDTAAENGQWFIHLMHGVGEGTYNIDKEVCREHFAYIGSKDDVWAGSLNDVLMYIYERDAAKIATLWTREKGMCISVTTPDLDSKLFNFPLTIKVNVPSDWKNIRVNQAGKIQNVSAADGYAYINIVPNGGDVIIDSMS